MRANLSAIIGIFFCAVSHAQDSISITSEVGNLPDKFLTASNRKTSNLDKQLTKQTERYLQIFSKREEKLRKQLYQLDSNATKNLFLFNTQEQYASYARKIRTDSVYDTKRLRGEYFPYADSLQGSLLFLKQNPQLLGVSRVLPADVQNSLTSLRQLQAKMQDAEQIKQYIRARKEQIKQYLLQFSHLPSGIKSIYDDYNKDLFYYEQQVHSYEEALNDPDKLMQKALMILDRLPAFQTFMKNNSILAALFPGQGGYGMPQGIAGLQTRDDIFRMIQQQLSGPNAQGAFSQSVNNAQSQLSQLRDKTMNYGQGGGDVDIPNFRPNMEKTKSFLSRLELGTDIQTQSSSQFYPATTDVGMNLSYKLDSRGNAVGLGCSYKIGWTNNIGHINLSSQGAGLRSFADIKMKGSFYLSAGLEYNYQQPFSSIRVVKNFNNWQQSGLLGVSKIISMRTKLFKKTRLQFLWDFLSYQQIPRAQPLKFRVGYNF